MTKDITNTIGYIYKIISPSNKVYIGQTINLRGRKYCYSGLRCKWQPKLYNSLKKYGWKKHIFEVIEECLCGKNKIYLNEREIYWIKFYDCFKNGMNCSEGGCGSTGYIASEETKEKIRIANTGRKHSDEAKEKVRKANLGLKHPHSEETKKIISKKHFGRVKKTMSDETKEKLRKLNTGTNSVKFGKKYPHSEDAKRKMRVSAIGNSNAKGERSKQTKLNISNSLKGKKRGPRSEETKEKLRQANLGKKLSEETKQKIRQANLPKNFSII